MRKAAMKYDFNADVKFLSYAVWWMRQAMIQAIEEKK
jgi:RNA polymerase primary sigma factor